MPTKTLPARPPCADCGKERRARHNSTSPWCSKCGLKHRCVICSHVHPERLNGRWCDECNRALAATLRLAGRCPPPAELLEGLLRRYESRAADELPLFEET